LAAFAAGEGEVRRLRAHAAREQDQQLRVFVVGVRADHQNAFVAAELPQRARQRSDAAGAGRGPLPQPGAGGADTKDKREPER
jgi:hypothetical protein